MKNKLDVYSPMKGKVKYVLKNESPYGRRIYIEYDNCLLLFAHLESIYVKENQELLAGTPIGLMGKTGYADSIHLHVSAFNKDAKELTAKTAVDPTYYLQLAPEYCCNMKVSNPFNSKFHNPALNKHEGIDFSGVNAVPDYDTKRIDPLFQDYLLQRNHPEFYEE